MSRYAGDYATTCAQLANLSQWIDDGNAHRDPEAVTWGRLAKISEEVGEVIDAYVGATGQNPRKGVYGGMDDVVKELLDVAVTALAAAEHMGGNDGRAMLRFVTHLDGLCKRVSLYDDGHSPDPARVSA